MRALTVRIGFLMFLALCIGSPGDLGRADDKKADEKKAPEKKAPEGVDPKMTSDDADYGYSTKKPIQVGADDLLGGPKAEHKYLDSLRDEDGKRVKYVRRGSVSGVGGSLLDEYVVTTSDGKHLTLYIDMYHPKNTPEKQLAPKGLYKAVRPAPLAAGAIKAKEYYPTQVGAEWVYRIGDREETQVVTEVKQKDGAKIVVIARVEAGKEIPAKTISLTPEAVLMVSLRDEEFDPAMCLLKLPPKPGDEWVVKAKLKNSEFRLTMTAKKPETLKVPAGTFEAIPVVETGTVGGKSFEVTHWYALGVGLVKYNVGETTVQELESFKQGKK